MIIASFLYLHWRGYSTLHGVRLDTRFWTASRVSKQHFHWVAAKLVLAQYMFESCSRGVGNGVAVEVASIQ